MAGANAQSPVETRLDRQIRHEAELTSVWPSRPFHPPFTDEIGPQSENGFARLLWAVSEVPEAVRTELPNVELEFTSFFGLITEERGWQAAEARTRRARELRERLRNIEPLTDALCGAIAADEFTLRLHPSAFAAFPALDDPRRDLYPVFLTTRRLLRADAVRLWADGDYTKAALRVAALAELAVRLNDDEPGRASWIQGIVAHDAAEMASSLARAPDGLRRDATQTVIAVLEKLDPDDPGREWAVVEAVVVETIDLLAISAAGEELDELAHHLLKPARAVRNMARVADGASLDRRPAPAPPTASQVRAQIEHARRSLEAIQAARETPDLHTVLTRVAAEAEADETGVLMVTIGILKNVERMRMERAEELRLAIEALRRRAVQ